MNCTNTISDGFYFWLGKMLAEFTVGVSVFLVIVIFFMIATVYNKKR